MPFRRPASTLRMAPPTRRRRRNAFDSFQGETSVRNAAVFGLVGLLALAPAAFAADKDKGDTKVPAVLNFKMKGLDGKEVDLSKYQGKVVLVVNVATFCGNTPQYKQLEALHEKYADKGLVVLGVPANEFGKQEPGTDVEIAKF